MAKKYRVTLTSQERADLEAMISKGKASARELAHLLGEPAIAELRAMALDGTTSRGRLTPPDAAVHSVAAMDQRTGCVPRRMRVDAETNEPKAALELLEGPTPRGRVVTGDAMSRQRDLSRQVVVAGGHYLWEVDEDQPSLKEAIGSAFEPAHRRPHTASSSR